MKILCIGNSFSQDTTKYAAEIACSLGTPDVLIGNLFIPGCPIGKHYENMANDLPAYRFDRNTGTGWEPTPETKISDAIRSEDWDWISIQHGTKYEGGYTQEDRYQNLGALVKMVKKLAGEHTKIAFNMTWVGEPTHNHREMLAFDRDQVRLFERICDVTQRIVAPTPGIDLVCPTGTAVQNARTTIFKDRMTRDGYHLSHDVGRYLAALMFLRALTGISIENVPWRPEGITDREVELIVKAINLAIEAPYQITTVL